MANFLPFLNKANSTLVAESFKIAKVWSNVRTKQCLTPVCQFCFSFCPFEMLGLKKKKPNQKKSWGEWWSLRGSLKNKLVWQWPSSFVRMQNQYKHKNGVTLELHFPFQASWEVKSTFLGKSHVTALPQNKIRTEELCLMKPDSTSGAWEPWPT